MHFYDFTQKLQTQGETKAEQMIGSNKDSLFMMMTSIEINEILL